MAARGRPRPARLRACPRAARAAAASSNCSTVARSQHSGGRTRSCATGRGRSRAPRRRSPPSDRCTWTDEPACPRRRSRGRRRAPARSVSRGWLIVISPSAQLRQPTRPSLGSPPRRAAAAAPAAASTAARGRPCTSPSWSTTSPANSARMTSTHSRSRALRIALRGHGSPVMCSLENFARAERDPEPPREHLRERRGGLGDDRRVVALPGRVDDAERQRGRLQRRPQPRPREARLALALAPGREVVGGHGPLEPGRLRLATPPEQRARRDLLVRGVEADRGHEAPPTRVPCERHAAQKGRTAGA